MIKALLLVAGAGLVAFFLANRRKARAKAGVKIGFVLFVVFMVYAVIRPDDLTLVANALGGQRGTDLVLYALVLGFAFVTVSTHVRFRAQQLRYARLARLIALQDAVRPEDEPSATDMRPAPDDDDPLRRCPPRPRRVVRRGSSPPCGRRPRGSVPRATSLG